VKARIFPDMDERWNSEHIKAGPYLCVKYKTNHVDKSEKHETRREMQEHYFVADSAMRLSCCYILFRMNEKTTGYWLNVLKQIW
jgi:hypothetical protein